MSEETKLLDIIVSQKALIDELMAIDLTPDAPPIDEWAASLPHNKRIAELEAEKSHAWETCQKAVERGMKLQAELERLREENAELCGYDSYAEQQAELERLRDKITKAIAIADQPMSGYAAMNIKRVLMEKGE